MLLEIGCDQAKSVSALASAAGMRCEIYKDYGGNDRVAYLKKASVRTEDITVTDKSKNETEN
jgi:methylase of polypeptide subunit release factors